MCRTQTHISTDSRKCFANATPPYALIDANCRRQRTTCPLYDTKISEFTSFLSNKKPIIHSKTKLFLFTKVRSNGQIYS